MRRVKYKDAETNITYEFITNNFKTEAITICKLYKQRWQVELFFKWIKQNLRIKVFYGTSRNAVLHANLDWTNGNKLQSHKKNVLVE